MKKIFAIILCLFAATGCKEEITTMGHINYGNEVCANNGGLLTIKNSSVNIIVYAENRRRDIYRAEIECNNGAIFTMNKTEQVR